MNNTTSPYERPAPIFAPDPPEQKKHRGQNLLLGCAGAMGVLVIVLLFVAVVLLNTGSGTGEDLVVGSDFPLYGITTQGEEFDWESFRGKYVLVKFTATWCGPCKMQIPGMREAYNKYHDKGLEIVSVYVWDDAEAIKQYAEREKLPWTIISEPLTTKAGHPPLGETFGIRGVPTMLLVDKEGKVLATNTRDHRLKQELKKLFD